MYCLQYILWLWLFYYGCSINSPRHMHTSQAHKGEVPGAVERTGGVCRFDRKFLSWDCLAGVILAAHTHKTLVRSMTDGFRLTTHCSSSASRSVLSLMAWTIQTVLINMKWWTEQWWTAHASKWNKGSYMVIWQELWVSFPDWPSEERPSNSPVHCPDCKTHRTCESCVDFWEFNHEMPQTALHSRPGLAL